MPNLTPIRAAYRAGIAANSANAPLLRDLRKPFREAGVDDIDDLPEALRYVHTTSPAAIDEGKWYQSWALIIPALAGMPWDGNRQVRDTRNKVRALMIDPSSPDWLKKHCERTKRTKLLDQNARSERVYDQQPTDPIAVAYEAALLVVAAANSTEQQAVEATRTIELWVELTPDLTPQ